MSAEFLVNTPSVANLCSALYLNYLEFTAASCGPVSSRIGTLFPGFRIHVHSLHYKLPGEINLGSNWGPQVKIFLKGYDPEPKEG